MPKPKFTLLFVEDVQNETDRFIRNLNEFNDNKSSPIHLEPVTAGSAVEALKLLSSTRFHAGMVDLRIPGPQGESSAAGSGNMVISAIVERYAMPVIAHSGYVGELEEELREYPILQLEKDEDSHEKAFEWLSGLTPLMKAVEAANDQIGKLSAKVFVGSIWPRWDRGHEPDLNEAALHQVITRQLVAYVSEHLVFPDDANPNHHLYEFYFDPPVRKDRLYTGDLIGLGDEFHVIVTPQCNIARTYPDHILLAKCREIKTEWSGLKEKIDQKTGSPNNKLKDKIKRLATQDCGIAEHFIPPCGERGPWMVEFKNLTSIPSSDAENLLGRRIASMAPQFIPNLVQRLSSYLGRVGQPDLDQDELIVHIRESSGAKE